MTDVERHTLSTVFSQNSLHKEGEENHKLDTTLEGTAMCACGCVWVCLCVSVCVCVLLGGGWGGVWGAWWGVCGPSVYSPRTKAGPPQGEKEREKKEGAEEVKVCVWVCI